MPLSGAIMKKPPAKSSANDPLRLLGKASALPTEPSRQILDSFPNSHPSRDYTIFLETEDFSSVCPVTGQPDYAEISMPDVDFVSDGVEVRPARLHDAREALLSRVGPSGGRWG